MISSSQPTRMETHTVRAYPPSPMPYALGPTITYALDPEPPSLHSI
jgi:hypothetical protein